MLTLQDLDAISANTTETTPFNDIKKNLHIKFAWQNKNTFITVLLTEDYEKLLLWQLHATGIRLNLSRLFPIMFVFLKDM